MSRLASSWSFPLNIFSAALAHPALIVLRTLANLLTWVVSEKFYFTFFFLNFQHLFPEICDLSGNFWSEAPTPVLYPLNDFKLTGIWSTVQSLTTDDLGQRCKVHSFQPNFLTSSNPHCKYKPFIKSIEFCLFGYRYWLKHFAAI